MSAQVKRAGINGMRILAGMLFVFLMLFNIQLAFDAGGSGEITLLGLKHSMFVPTAMAVEPPSPGQQCVSNCGYNDCCRICFNGGAWIYYYDYTSSGCGSCPNWC